MINVLAAITGIICIISLGLGIHIIRLDWHRRLHQLFFLSIATIALYNFCAMMVYAADTEEILIFWYRLGAPTIMILPLMLHTNLELVKLKKPIKYAILIPFYLMPIYFIYQEMNLNLSYIDFIKRDGMWHFIEPEKSVNIYLVNIFMFLTYCLCFIFLIRGYVKARQKREKKQILVFIFSLAFLIAMASFIQIILPFFSDQDFGINPIILSLWPIGTGIAIIKYRFLGIGHEHICEEVFENIEESVILLDTAANVILVNEKAKGLVPCGKKATVDRLIVEHKIVRERIEALLKDGAVGFTTHLHYQKKDDTPVLMSARFSLVRDKFGDITGVLLIAREVLGIKEFIAKFRLTEREFEVIRLLITGICNREISSRLNVAESTIKTHIEHIYNKTDAKNKMELVNLMKTHNVML